MQDYRGKSLPRKVHGVLFDFDGTLMDLTPKWWKPIERAFTSITGTVPEQDLIDNIARIFHKMPQKPSRLFLGKVMYSIGRAGGLSRFKSLKFIRRASMEFQQSKFTNIPLPGIPEMVTTLKSRGYRIGIVSTASRQELDKAAKEFEFLRDLPLISRDDVSELKPSPQPIQIGSKEIDVAISNVLYVGDFRTDVIAGKAAGSMTCATLGVYPNLSKEPLESTDPDIIVEYASDLVDFLL